MSEGTDCRSLRWTEVAESCVGLYDGRSYMASLGVEMKELNEDGNLNLDF